MNRLSKIFILTILVISVFIINGRVSALEDYNNGSGGNYSYGQGTWQYYEGKGGYGLRVTVINKNSGKRAKDTHSVNIVRNKTLNGKKIYTSKQSHTKLYYMAVKGAKLTLGKNTYHIIKDANVPDFAVGGVDNKLRKNNYALLGKYVKKTGYKCWNNTKTEGICASKSNYLVIVEPITVEGTYGARYDWLTSYEFAKKINSGNMVNVYKRLNNALYNTKSYSIAGETFEAGKTCSQNDGYTDCRDKILAQKLSGIGVYRDPKKIQTKSRLTVKKKWKTDNAYKLSDDCKGNKTKFVIQYKNGKKGKAKTLYNIEIKGAKSVTKEFKYDSNRYYRVKEKSVSVTSGCKKTYKQGTKPSPTGWFKIGSNKNKSVTFTNSLKSKPTPEDSTGTITVHVYKMANGFRLQKKSITDSNLSGYYYQPVYGGLRDEKNKKLYFQIYKMVQSEKVVPKMNEPIPEWNDYTLKYWDYSNTDNISVPENVLKYLTTKNMASDVIGVPGYIDYDSHQIMDLLDRCKNYYGELWRSDSWSCYKFCKGVNCTIAEASDKVPLFSKDLVGQEGVEVNVTASAADVSLSGTTDSDGKIKFEKLPKGYSYKVTIDCEDCGGENTIARTNRANIAYTQGTAAAGFDINTISDNYVTFINNNSNYCSQQLKQIKESGVDLKTKLLDLYNEEKINGHVYDALLNFSPDDDDDTIKKNIDNTIFCGNLTNSNPQPELTVQKSCNTGVSIKYNPKIVANYIKTGDYSKNLASNLFDLDDDEDFACYIDYQLTFDKIKNNPTKLINSSWLWSSPIKNQIGEMKATVHCVGNVRNHNFEKEIKANDDMIIEMFKESNLELITKNGKSLDTPEKLQSLQFLSSDSVGYLNRSLIEDNDDSAAAISGESGTETAVFDEDLAAEEEITEFEEMLNQESKCGADAHLISNACYKETDQKFCPEGYQLRNGTTCRKNDSGKILDDKQACGSAAVLKNYVCYIEAGQPFCPEGYELNSKDYKCYKNDFESSEETSGEGDGSNQQTEFQSKDIELSFAISYNKTYFSDLLSGTMTTTKGGKRLIGYGVPVPMDSTSGKIKFDYILDSDSDLYKFYDNVKTGTMNNINYECSYERTDTSAQNRFISTSNPFPGKNATLSEDDKGRPNGLNWDSCYTALTQRLGYESKISCYDLYGEKSSNCPTGDTYCLYGDINCNGDINETDYEIFQSVLSTTYHNPQAQETAMIYKMNKMSIYSKFQSDKWRYLVDLNQDNLITDVDGNLFLTWYEYQFGSGYSINKQGEENKIAFSDKSTYFNYDKTDPNGNFGYCNSYIYSIIENENKSSDSTGEPLYSFTLSSKDLVNIRNYSNKSYLETEDMDCNSYGICTSQFITNLIKSQNGLTLSAPLTGTCKNRVNNTIKKDNTEKDISSYSEIFCK